MFLKVVAVALGILFLLLNLYIYFVLKYVKVCHAGGSGAVPDSARSIKRGLIALLILLFINAVLLGLILKGHYLPL